MLRSLLALIYFVPTPALAISPSQEDTTRTEPRAVSVVQDGAEHHQQADDQADDQAEDDALEGPGGDERRSWVGVWSTSYGELTFDLAADGTLTGAYQNGAVRDVKFTGGRMEFRYVEPQAGEIRAEGTGWFELDKTGERFVGQWRPKGSTRWFPWTGSRTVVAAGPWDGLWDTSFGRMRLSQDGEGVTGAYSMSPESSVQGTAAADRFTFRYDDETTKGEGWFRLSRDKTRFHGRWRADGANTWQDWSGKRVLPSPSVRWLVILEARWETGLSEPEYAFGDMLQSYFTMAPARHVEVRHRFFHDRADFIRFARSVQYLAEPVTVVVSTHGTKKGIQVAGTTISAEDVAKALRDASNVTLLHLSGCAMMNGEMPGRIQAALRRGASFPVSGYTRNVAWDASAISDFVYLSLVLIRGLTPEAAVAQAHLVAPYTGEARVKGSVFKPMGLRILGVERSEPVHEGR